MLFIIVYVVFKLLSRTFFSKILKQEFTVMKVNIYIYRRSFQYCWTFYGCFYSSADVVDAQTTRFGVISVTFC